MRFTDRVGSSYLPRDGAAAEQLLRDVDTLFDRSAQGGFVQVALRTIVVRIDLDSAG